MGISMSKANAGRSGRKYRVRGNIFSTVKELADHYDVPESEMTTELKKDGGEPQGGPRSPDGWPIRIVYIVDPKNYQE